MQTNDAQAVTASAAVTARVNAWLAEQERPRAWLARRIGVSGPTIGRRLDGEQPWTLDELDELERVTGIPVDRLVARVDEDEDPFDDAPSDDARFDHLAAMGDALVRDAGSARVAGLLLVVLGALVVGWVAPYGVPVAALGAVVVLGALVAGVVAVARRRPVVAYVLVPAAVAAGLLGVALPVDDGAAAVGPSTSVITSRPTVTVPVTGTPTRRPRPTITIPGVTPTLPTSRPTRPTVTRPS